MQASQVASTDPVLAHVAKRHGHDFPPLGIVGAAWLRVIGLHDLRSCHQTNPKYSKSSSMNMSDRSCVGVEPDPEADEAMTRNPARAAG